MKVTVKIPEDVTASINMGRVTMKGKQGEIKKEMAYPGISLSMPEPRTIVIESKKSSKQEKRIINTFESHVNNMIKGVTKGYTYKLKLVYVHFPATMKIEGDIVKIENYLGERAVRTTKIVHGVKVSIQKQDITVTGADLEAVSQTAANLEQATRLVGRDRRVFQDGIFITHKDA